MVNKVVCISVKWPWNRWRTWRRVELWSRRTTQPT